jgi:hypothetical protein
VKSSLTIPPANPYYVEFALLITSSKLSYLRIHITGPNISSFAIIMSSLTSANMVGYIKYPFSPTLFPPKIKVAPSSFPFYMYLRIFSN